MKRLVAFLGLVTFVTAAAQETLPNALPEAVPAPSQPIADCATDVHERGRPGDMPVEPVDLAALRAALDLDLAGIQPGGLAGFGAVEPACFYWVADGRALMRDARGWEFYFRQALKWMPDQVNVRTPPQSE